MEWNGWRQKPMGKYLYVVRTPGCAARRIVAANHLDGVLRLQDVSRAPVSNPIEEGEKVRDATKLLTRRSRIPL